MPIEQTLSMIKPDGVARGLIGDVIGRFEKHGLKIRAMKMLHLSLNQAQAFYDRHRQPLLLASLLVALLLVSAAAVAGTAADTWAALVAGRSGT